MLKLSDVSLFLRVVREGFDRLSARSKWAAYTQQRAPFPAGGFPAAVHFADDMDNYYQLRQWHEPLLRLSRTHPVAVITRDARAAVRLKDLSPLPVVCLPSASEVEAWVASQPLGAVFYLNQNSLNFQMMRVREPAHIFLSHGESDKDYMASNQLKAYDYTFVAGEAARERLRTRLIGYDVEGRTVQIGRPQVDVHHETPVDLPHDSRTVVFYAPTWEGDRPSMSYSSVLSHGPALIRALVATGEHRVIYRQHPRTGLKDSGYRTAHLAIVKALETANKTNPGAGHVVDVDTDFGWQLTAADACVTDISAVAFDWLATGKPLVLTEPVSALAKVDVHGIAGSLPLLPATRASAIVNVLAEGDDAASRATREALAKRYFGDITPGASMQRWLEAATAVIVERQQLTSQLPDSAT